MPRLQREFARYGKTFFGFYIDTKDAYTNFIADNKRLDRELTAAGIPHVFALYPGAHNGTFGHAPGPVAGRRRGPARPAQLTKRDSA